VADLAASIVYVPSEVLKTRLQLQGRYKNPFFHSGYNYRSTWDAARTIARTEGYGALYSGYKATIVRDLPFSALQFAFYEQERRFAMHWADTQDIGLELEVATAVSAGGAAGILTCPLDVVKTRTQTQISPNDHGGTNQISAAEKLAKVHKPKNNQSRMIHSGPRTVPRTIPTLDASSVMIALKLIYKTEGVAGWFRGVGPRAVWTGVQTGTMLVMYQYLLKYMERIQPYDEPEVI
jgi:Mitochondrial carrier protein